MAFLTTSFERYTNGEILHPSCTGGPGHRGTCVLPLIRQRTSASWSAGAPCVLSCREEASRSASTELHQPWEMVDFSPLAKMAHLQTPKWFPAETLRYEDSHWQLLILFIMTTIDSLSTLLQWAKQLKARERVKSGLWMGLVHEDVNRTLPKGRSTTTKSSSGWHRFEHLVYYTFHIFQRLYRY